MNAPPFGMIEGLEAFSPFFPNHIYPVPGHDRAEPPYQPPPQHPPFFAAEPEYFPPWRGRWPMPPRPELLCNADGNTICHVTGAAIVEGAEFVVCVHGRPHHRLGHQGTNIGREWARTGLHTPRKRDRARAARRAGPGCLGLLGCAVM
jgi:hypothetical protein